MFMVKLLVVEEKLIYQYSRPWFCRIRYAGSAYSPQSIVVVMYTNFYLIKAKV